MIKTNSIAGKPQDRTGEEDWRTGRDAKVPSTVRRHIKRGRWEINLNAVCGWWFSVSDESQKASDLWRLCDWDRRNVHWENLS